MSGLFDGDLVNLIMITKLTVHYFWAIYTTSMGFSPYSTEIRQFKIPLIVSFELIAKYFTHQ